MKRAFVVLLLLVVTAALFGLEVEQGRVRLVLHEDSSRFSLYVQPSGQDADSAVALFFAEDPRTSELAILEGNRVLRMGTSGGFSQDVARLSDGAMFAWTSSTLRVEQRFRFIRSVGSSVADGVEITVTIENLSERTTTVAVRQLFDTYLGEQSNSHFSTPVYESVTRETDIRPSAAQSWWSSSSGEPGETVQQMIYGDAVSTPEQVVLANWKRLSESDWSFDVNDGRSFNLLPYSINDSAVLVIYPEVVVAPGESHSVVTQLGGYAPDGYQSGSVSATDGDPQAALEEVNAIIDEIDRLLGAETVSADDVARVRQLIENLKSAYPGM